MIGATLFSGIGAPETAMPSWEWPWHAEIEKFPSAVLKARHPDSVNLGDVNAHDFCERAAAIAKPSIIVFGSPCQSFSVAGKRLGLDDPRGNLALVALGIVARLEPRWFVFENVPGLLSSAEGSDFGIFLRTVDELGYSLAWTVLDAQYFGVAQRRERVFAVGYLGDWRGPAAVLFEPEGLQGHYPPRRQAGKGTTSPTSGSLNTSIARGTGQGHESDFLIAAAVTSDSRHAQIDQGRGTLVSHALRADGFDASEDGTGRGTPLVPVAFHSNQSFSSGDNVDIAPTLRIGSAGQGQPPAIAFSSKDHGADAMDDLSPTLRAGTHNKSHANAGVPPAIAFGAAVHTTGHQGDRVVGAGDIHPALSRETANNGGGAGALTLVPGNFVRRLTPTECEALQGYPRDYTLIRFRGKPAADGPRYKALGNSMAVPVMRWILSRIETLEGDSLTVCEPQRGMSVPDSNQTEITRS